MKFEELTKAIEPLVEFWAVFEKYPSLLNIKHKKEIDRWLEYNPILLDPNLEFVVSEKIHGTNFQMSVENHPEMGVPFWEFGSRTGFLDVFDDHHDWRTQVDQIKVVNDYLAGMFNATTVNKVTLYFEYYGSGIMKGIQYCEQHVKKFALIGVRIDGRLLTYKEMCEDFGRMLPIAPRLCVIKGFWNAVHFAQNRYLDRPEFGINGDQIMEGVIIQPYDVLPSYVEVHNKAPEDHDGLQDASVHVGEEAHSEKFFIVKCKSKKFSEQTQRVKNSRPPSEINPLFLEFLNDNRMQAIVSKHGEPKSNKDIGRYVQLLIDDAKEDFFLTYPEYVGETEKRDFNHRGIAPELIMEYL